MLQNGVGVINLIELIHLFKECGLDLPTPLHTHKPVPKSQEAIPNHHGVDKADIQQAVRELDALDRGQLPLLLYQRQQGFLRNQRLVLIIQMPRQTWTRS